MGGVTQCEKVVTTECARQGANRWAGVVTICLDVQVEGKGMERSSGEGNLLEARSTEPITRLGGQGGIQGGMSRWMKKLQPGDKADQEMVVPFETPEVSEIIRKDS